MTLVWIKEFETGHPLVDFQHRQLLNALVTLRDTCAAGKAKDRVEGTLDFLISFAAKHVRDMEEEKSRLGSRYPFRFSDNHLHENLIRFVAELEEKLKNDGPSPELKEEIDFFLKDALVGLVNHINREKEAQIAAELDSMTDNDDRGEREPFGYDAEYEKNGLHPKHRCRYCSNPAHYPVVCQAAFPQPMG